MAEAHPLQKDASKKFFVATEILVFGFELFIGERYDLFGDNLAACEKRGPCRTNQHRPRSGVDLRINHAINCRLNRLRALEADTNECRQSILCLPRRASDSSRRQSR